MERVFGLRVKALRQTHSWTQDELARRMTDAGYPLHQTTLAKLESGTRPTSIGEAATLATLFGVPISALFSLLDDTVDGLLHLRTLVTKLRLLRAEAQRAEEESAAQLRRSAELEVEIQTCLGELKELGAAHPEWGRELLTLEALGVVFDGKPAVEEAEMGPVEIEMILQKPVDVEVEKPVVKGVIVKGVKRGAKA